MHPNFPSLKVQHGRASARDWLIHWLAANGPAAKRVVIAAYLRYCHAHPPKQARKRLEEAFQRAKRGGLVTGDKTEWQGPSIWRLCEPGEVPRLWLRRSPEAASRPYPKRRRYLPGFQLSPVTGERLWHFDYGPPRGCGTVTPRTPRQTSARQAGYR